MKSQSQKKKNTEEKAIKALQTDTLAIHFQLQLLAPECSKYLYNNRDINSEKKILRSIMKNQSQMAARVSKIRKRSEYNSRYDETEETREEGEEKKESGSR